jgi:serine/threonine-protein kinase
LALLLAVVAGWGWLRPPPERERLLQVDVAIGGVAENDAPALSPDGTRLAYVLGEDGTTLLARDLADTAANRIGGTDDYWTPFFSPDGKSIGYMTGFPGALKVLTLDGGQVRTVIPSDVYANGGAWADDGWIYYSGGERYGNRLMRVRAEGGASQVVAEPDSSRNERAFFYPRALPGGRRLLLTIVPLTGDASVALLDIRTKAVTPLAKGVAAFYAAPGYLVILQADGLIRAAEFDGAGGKVNSSFVTLAAGANSGSELRAPMAVSRSGTMLHFSRPPNAEVVRVTRDGRETPLVPGWKGYFASLSLSPDGSRLAISVNTGGRTEIWVKTLPDGPFTRVVAGVNLTYRPSWSPDGRDLVFTSDLAGFIGGYRVPADGSRPPELLVSTTAPVDEALISRDGKWVVYRQGSGTGRHLAALQIGVDSVGRVLLPTSRAQEYSPNLSPDGRWLAYASDESGRDEVYIRPFPDVESARYPVSRNGGTEPLWSHSGRELFFRTPAGEFVAAAIAPGAAPTVTSLRVLFRTEAYLTDVRHRQYTVAADDQSFLFVRNPAVNAPTRTRLTTSIDKLYRARAGR